MGPRQCISNDWRIGNYITFATQFTLLFGLSFELPVVVMVFVKIGLLAYETMRRTRSYAIVAIFAVAAIITPTPDAFTLCLMAGPMVVLYEICIWLAYFDDKKQRRKEAEEELQRHQEDRERMERLLLSEGENDSDSGTGDDNGDSDKDPETRSRPRRPTHLRGTPRRHRRSHRPRRSRPRSRSRRRIHYPRLPPRPPPRR